MSNTPTSKSQYLEQFLAEQSEKNAEIEKRAARLRSNGWTYEQLIYYAADLEIRTRDLIDCNKAGETELNKIYTPIATLLFSGGILTDEELQEKLKKMENMGSPIFIAIHEMKKINARMAAASRNTKKIDPLKEHAFKIVRDHVATNNFKWPSARKAAATIKNELQDFARKNNLKVLSDDQAQTTIAGWLNNLPDRDALFASKRNTLARSRDIPAS